MAKLSAVQTDPALEAGGVWVHYTLGIRLKIARLGNPAYQKRLTELRQPMLSAIRTRTVDAAKADDVLKQCAAEELLKGWENVTDDDDKPIEYSPERGLDVFRDPRYRDLYEFVMATAADAAIYRKELAEGARGNSQRSSDG
jgi:hypothetical protein